MNTKSRIPLVGSLAMLSLGLSATGWSQSAVPITNPGFEDPVTADGTVGGLPTGWTSFNGATADVLNPDANDFTAEAPEGQNVASIFDANGSEEGLSQVLAATFQDGAGYTLTVEVGNSKYSAVSFPGYRVQLFAGGTLLAEDDNSLTIAEDSFSTSTVNYTYDAGDAALVGQPLEIRLLSKGLAASDEVCFDDVQLTVALADPVANAGGPYVVVPSGSLELDGSASVPSGGETLTLYEWDLNNDDTFGDVTGETPAAISFSDLQSVHGLALGSNTIQLRVTDSSTATATATATVILQLAEVTPGFDFLADAGQDDGGNDRWEDVTGLSGLELLLDDSPAVTHVPVTTNTLLTHAYDFVGGSTGKEAGALLVDVGTTTERSFQNTLEDWTNDPVTMEMWIRPDNLTPGVSNGQIIFEDGGGTGMGLFVNNNQLQFRKLPGSGLVSYDISTDPLGLLLGPATEEFIQVVMTYDTATGSMQMFINGGLVGTSNPGGNDWSGGDNVGFGTLGGNNVGGIGNGQQNTVSYNGLMSLIRVYHNQILTPEEVENNFIAVRGPDEDPPFIVSLDPADETTDLYPGITLTATFNEDVQFTGTGSVTIKNLTAVTEQVITLPDAQVSLSGRDLIIDPAANLAFDSTFAVLISGNALEDFSGNAFPGISDDTVWNVSTAAQDLNPPLISVKSPEDDVTGVSIGANIVATFDQNLIPGTGDIVIKDLLDDSTTQTIAVTDTSQVTLSDNVLTINPAAFLESGRSYAVQIPGTALRNFSDVDFAGIANDTEWNFTTAALASQLGILDLTTNGGINPNTGEAWKAGDSYHLLYCTMGDTPATATDIAFYNAFVQADAANQTVPGFENLGTVNWFALGSTTTTNAVDNVIITGAVINAYDNATIAVDAADMWDFLFTQNRTDLEGNLRNVWTGSTVGGVGDGGDQLGATDGNARRHWSGWTDWVQANNNQATSSLQYLMGISERLFVYDTLDAAAPALVSIEDNVSGGPVTAGDPVVYTVTFDEAMLPGTVNAADFSNAGSSAITIGSIVQLEDPSVFEVTVTPTTVGTLQLRIPAGATLTDLAGNALDTGSAFTDDTVITVETDASYISWAGGFAGLTDPDPALDFDAGGLETGLEWVLGGDPTDGSDDAGIAPTFDNTSDPDFFIFTYRRADEAAADANTTIAAQYGSDLAGWTDAVAGTDIVITPTDDGAGAGIDLVEVKIRRTLAVDGKLFVRLNVEVAQP
ncbi:MAG TPA: Ig-like domain-containing protein [Luteolibacter sp.]|nr:Ig-like domain-containing protein [Luteolibacter sp.]